MKYYSKLILKITLFIALVTSSMTALVTTVDAGFIFPRFLFPWRNQTAIHESGEKMVSACSKFDHTSESCYWNFRYDQKHCSVKKPCDKLVIYFSGGEMNCDDSFDRPHSQYRKVLQSYVDDGYLAVCAGIFVTGQAAKELPYHGEAKRIDALLMDIRDSSTVKALWSGKHLLFAGISHGSTAPVIAMAHTTLDNQSHWKGSVTTAACFHDGVYDVVATDKYMQQGEPHQRCNALRSSSLCNRYSDKAVSCPPLALSNKDVSLDSLKDIRSAEFAIQNWKLVECGSALPACAENGDWAPAGPIRDLCTALDKGSQHTCVFDSQPKDSHVACMSTQKGMTICRDWFDKLQ